MPVKIDVTESKCRSSLELVIFYQETYRSLMNLNCTMHFSITAF